MSRRLKIIALASSFAGFAATAGAYHLGFDLLPPRAVLADGTTVPLPPSDVQVCFKTQALTLIGDGDAESQWELCQQWLAKYDALEAFDRRSLGVAASGAMGLVALFGFALSVRYDRPSFKVTRGAKLHTGSAGLKAFARACARECRILGRGVELLPDIPIARDRETRHFLILGSVGGGKTQTMLHLIVEAIFRDDGVLVLDTKGDMMAGLPALPTPLLVAPHDRRSLVWDVAADCCVKQDARELAARFIPPSADPMWSQAAQEIFVACIVHLQATKGRNWSWSDLEAVVTADVEVLSAHAKDYNPNALRLLNQPESKTTLSILTTFQTHMRIVSVLAEAWRDASAGRFSIRGWLHSPPPPDPAARSQLSRVVPDLDRQHVGLACVRGR